MVTRLLLYGPITLFLTKTYYNNTSMNACSRTYSYASKPIPYIQLNMFSATLHQVNIVKICYHAV